MPATPCLLAVYDTTRMPPWNESRLAMLTILPCPRSTIGRPRCWERKNSPVRLTSSTWFQASSVTSTESWRSMMPALFTRMSTWRSAASRRTDALDGVVVAHVEVDDLDVAAEVARPGLGSRPGCRAGRQHQVGARPGEPEGDRLAEAAAGTGHDGAPAVQVEGERSSARSGAHRSSSGTGVRSV